MSRDPVRNEINMIDTFDIEKLKKLLNNKRKLEKVFKKFFGEEFVRVKNKNVLRDVLMKLSGIYVAEYLVELKKKDVEVIAKIKFYRHDNRAWRDYKVTSFIYGRIEDDILPCPLGYIEDMKAFFYIKAPGISLADMFAKKAMKKKLDKAILEVAAILARIHRLNSAPTEKFLMEYPIAGLCQNSIRRLKGIDKVMAYDAYVIYKKMEEYLSKMRKRTVSVLHGDSQPENFLVGKRRLRIFDFDNSYRGDHLIDVANLIYQMTYKGILPQKKVMYLRKKFLGGYLKYYKEKVPYLNERLNLFFLISLFNNLNLHYVRNDMQAMKRDIKSMFYFIDRFNKDPIENLKNEGKYHLSLKDRNS